MVFLIFKFRFSVGPLLTPGWSKWAHSSVRQALGLAFAGKVFRDRFLIADVRMQADFPAERWARNMAHTYNERLELRDGTPAAGRSVGLP